MAYETAGASIGLTPETFMSPLTLAHENFGAITDRLERLADKLCGPVPQDAGSKLSAVPTVGGVFGEVSDRGRDLGRKSERAFAALSRIESMLP